MEKQVCFPCFNSVPLGSRVPLKMELICYYVWLQGSFFATWALLWPLCFSVYATGWITYYLNYVLGYINFSHMSIVFKVLVLQSVPFHSSMLVILHGYACQLWLVTAILGQNCLFLESTLSACVVQFLMICTSACVVHFKCLSTVGVGLFSLEILEAFQHFWELSQWDILVAFSL